MLCALSLTCSHFDTIGSAYPHHPRTPEVAKRELLGFHSVSSSFLLPSSVRSGLSRALNSHSSQAVVGRCELALKRSLADRSAVIATTASERLLWKYKRMHIRASSSLPKLAQIDEKVTVLEPYVP